MKTIFRLFFLLLFLIPSVTKAQSDCPDAIIVCGDADYTNLNATGIGTQELGANACNSVEHNSLWLKILIKHGGTLGFILTPENADDLVVDFDFWIFGPNVDCNNLGTAVRCSTTNPLQAGLDYTITGMNEEETDTSEGPGPDGNAFVHWMDVNDLDTYYLIIDRPHGASNFSLQWTGTATFFEIPVFNNPDNIPLDMTKCDDDGVDDNSTLFDLTVYADMFIGDQDDVNLTYHLTQNDMTTGENPITNPEAFTNTSDPQTIYLRMTNVVTGCYANETFTVGITHDSSSPQDLRECDNDGDGIAEFNLSDNDTAVTNGEINSYATYFASEEDANNNENPIGPIYQNQVPFQDQQIWSRLNKTGQDCYFLNTFTIGIINPPQFSTPNNLAPAMQECDDDNTLDHSTIFNLRQNEALLDGNSTDFSFEYYEDHNGVPADTPIANPDAYANTSDPQTVYVKMTNTQTGCYAISPFTLSITPFTAGQPDDLVLCDDNENGLQEFDLSLNNDAVTDNIPNTAVTYYATPEDAANRINPIGPLYQNTEPYTQPVYARLTAQDGCYDIVSFNLTVQPLPVINEPQGGLEIQLCDDDGVDDGSVAFDLTTHETLMKGNQQNTECSYFLNMDDLTGNVNPITNPESYPNISNPQTIYVRMQDTITGCVSSKPMIISIDYDLPTGPPDDLKLCDDKSDGQQWFNLTENDNAIKTDSGNQQVTYYATQEDAENGTNPLQSPYENSEPYTDQTIWARLENITGCFGYGITSFSIHVLPIPEIHYKIDVTDFKTFTNSITVNITDHAEDYEFSMDGENFSDNNYFGNLPPGIYTIFIRSKDDCQTISEQVPVLNYPKFFTPNADGNNEYWNIYYLFAFPDAEVAIFDRYGKLVKSYLGSQRGWDGTYNGRNLPATDYWFVLRFKSGRTIKGHFSLIR